MASPSSTCGSLLRELQVIWGEIGESDSERDRMLLQLEQDCLDIYGRMVDVTRQRKADLHQQLADAETEIADIASALGETASFSRVRGTLNEQLSAVQPILEELKLRKQERIKEFRDTQKLIDQICAEISGGDDLFHSSNPKVKESDLTTKGLAELKSHLKELQNEKNLRLQKVVSNIGIIQGLSVTMAFDIFQTLADIHPSLRNPVNNVSTSISNGTLAKLTSVIQSLKEEKQQRLSKLQKLGTMLTDLWNLMDTPLEERRIWGHVTCLMSSSVDEVLEHGVLAPKVIDEAEGEVQRLNVLKVSKMKELVFKRQDELEEIYKAVHMDVDGHTARQILTNLIESGTADMSDLLSSMDGKITQAKEQALSRKDILEKVEKWICATEEEKWLDDYEKDGNRFSAGRGAHKNLKRAEKARILAGKLPSLVESLVARVKAWESDKGIPFIYDKAPLLKKLEEYTVLRQEREEEKRRSREQKRLQEQLATEQEAIYGSRPKKPLGQSTNANTMVGTPGRRVHTPLARHGISSGKERRESRAHLTPINYVSLTKEDSVTRNPR